MASNGSKLSTPGERSSASAPEQSEGLFRLVIGGAWRFAVVSLAAFSVWAFGSKWFRPIGGEPTMYAAIAVVFMGLSGLLMYPLMNRPRPIWSFYRAFMPAFFAYAAIWSACWFGLGAGWGEWLGAALGGLAFVVLSAWHFENWRGGWWALAGFLVLHTLGYYLGGWSMGKLLVLARAGHLGGLDRSQGVTLAKLSWGLAYGLGFGGGTGWVFGWLRDRIESRGKIQ